MSLSQASLTKAKQTRETTAHTTRAILDFLLLKGCRVWRHNVLPVPLPGGRGFRPGSKSGVPDIIGFAAMGVLHPNGQRDEYSRLPAIWLSVEVKTGKDRLRPEQEGFARDCERLKAVHLIVKDFEDFLRQWKELV